MVCLTDDLAGAWFHAECMTESDIAIAEIAAEDNADFDIPVIEPVVFAIPTGRLARGGFTIERNFIRLGPSVGKAAGQRLPKRRWNWFSLLKHTGGVGYVRPIPISRADMLHGAAQLAEAAE